MVLDVFALGTGISTKFYFCIELMNRKCKLLRDAMAKDARKC